MLGGRRFLLGCAVLAAVVLLALGLRLPFMRLSSLLLIGHGAQEHALLSAALSLLRSNQVLLGGVLLALTLFLLVRLMLLLLLVLLPPRADAWLSAAWPDLAAFAAWLGHWGAQDVLAVAAAAAIIASRETLLQHTAAGAYCLAGAVIAMALAYMWRRNPGKEAAWPAPVPPRGMAFALLAGLAALALGLGVTLPVVRLSTEGAAGGGQSMIDLVLALKTPGGTVARVGLAILALVLPGLRVLYLLAVAAARVLPGAVVRSAEALGRYTTVDLTVLSLALLYLMETHVVAREVLPGIYALAAAAALTLAGYAWANTPASAKTAAKRRGTSAGSAALAATQQAERS